MPSTRSAPANQRQLGRSNARAAVIVRMQGDDQVFAIVEITAHPLDLVGIDVRRRHLDRGRQVQDQLVVGRRLDDLGDCVADFQGHVQLRAGEALRRIFEPEPATGLGRHVGNHLGSVGCDLLDALDVLGKHHAALQFAGRIVEMHDRLGGALQRFKRAGDQLGTALDQDLQGDVGGNIALPPPHQRAKSKSVCDAEEKNRSRFP